MNRRLKIVLMIFSAALIILIAGGYTLKIFSGAFGAECEESQSWIVENYTIKESKCLGWVGPHYYPIALYRNGGKMDLGGSKLDSCNYQFIPKNDLYLIINICQNQLTEFRLNKELLKSSNIDSVLMISKKTDEVKKLARSKINKIVTDWNKSEVSEYRHKHKDSLFYPDYYYKIKVYQDGVIKEFTTGNFMIADESKWVFYMTKTSNSDYFERIWAE